MFGNPSRYKQIGQFIKNVLCLDAPCYPDTQAFSGVLINDVQQSQWPTVLSALCYKVIAPDMILMPRPESHTGAVIEPESFLLRLLLRNFQPFLPPDAFNALMGYSPAFLLQHPGYHPIAISAVLFCQGYDPIDEPLLFF